MLHGMGELILIRHGQTEWSRSGRLGGRTDLPLTDAGVATGKALALALAQCRLAATFSSPLSRALQTAKLAGLSDVKPDADLMEWDYGGYEGMTERQIRKAKPGSNLWRDGVIPGDADHPGERLQQVAERTDACWTGSGRCRTTGTSPWSRTAICSVSSRRAGSAWTRQPAACSSTRIRVPSAP